MVVHLVIQVATNQPSGTGQGSTKPPPYAHTHNLIPVPAAMLPPHPPRSGAGPPPHPWPSVGVDPHPGRATFPQPSGASSTPTTTGAQAEHQDRVDEMWAKRGVQRKQMK
ncbi:submaxillary gland androgen-regulated protein 3A-like [Corythoichthys intestinalis]|uniref:submaxillary gland androgen-regulated protein 3A-like n=1 Tax=Corythoichthys intestinalis TaxID=161448 RepID=UPI0025A533CE|nr:submaxillary gland androgen-regulated protein 3A-like [Corythoichthys intestinalis]